MIPLPNWLCNNPPLSVICPRPNPGNSMLPSHPSNPSDDMNVGRYSAQPDAEPDGRGAPGPEEVGAVTPGKWDMYVAEGEFWTDSEGPAAEGRILSC